MSDAATLPPAEYLADREGERLDAFLARRIAGVSRSQVQRWIESGQVRVEGALERAGQRLGFGAVVTVWPAASAAPPAAEAIPLDILYEDAALLVINKPPDLPVHPAPGTPDGTLVNALLAHCPSLAGLGDVLRPGIVHRLDRDTSGVMVVAKTLAAQEDLQRQIRARTVTKRYLAVVAGIPDPAEGLIDAPVGRDPADPRRMAVVEGGKASQTEYRVVEQFVDASLVELRLITGRTHQIRVHLAALGHPVIGDAIYGHASPAIPRQALHAFRLGFQHPASGTAVQYDAPLPADMQALLQTLRTRASLLGAALPAADNAPAAAGRRPRKSGSGGWRTGRRVRRIR